MSVFAAEMEHSPDYDSLSLAWLAGVLEAERTFLAPPPSAPNSPVVACGMTDFDVIERIAGAFGTSIQSFDRPGCRTEFSTRARGARAIALANDLAPLMSERRRAAINKMQASYSPPVRKLSFEKAAEISRRYLDGETAAELARRYKVSHPTIRAVLNGWIYVNRPPEPWRAPMRFVHSGFDPPPGITQHRFLWLAGWLEGEGSFSAPAPSSPKRARVGGKTRDMDVALEVAQMFGVKPSLIHSVAAKENGWSPIWDVLLRGPRAEDLMRRLRRIMGIRRAEQIDYALEATAYARDSGGGSRSAA